jgi:hypothetical protein
MSGGGRMKPDLKIVPEPLVIGDKIPPEVFALVNEAKGNRNRRAHYNGTGVLSSTIGKPSDSVHKRYDEWVILDLVVEGITDRNTLATAIATRPAGAVAMDGEDAEYVEEVVDTALAKMYPNGVDDEVSVVDFKVIKATMTSSNPKGYSLVTSDGTIPKLDTKELTDPKKFINAYLNATGKIPSVPTDRNDLPLWHEEVNRWLETAEVDVQPKEASEWYAFRFRIIEIIDNLIVGEYAEDFESDFKVEYKGQWAFKPKSVVKILNRNVAGSQKDKLTDIHTALEDVGCGGYITGDGKKPRVLFDFPCTPEAGETVPSKKKKVRILLTPKNGWPDQFQDSETMEETSSQLLLPWFGNQP